MSLSDRILDLSLRKVINRGRSLLGLGDPGLKPLLGVNELLGEEQASAIAAMPRYTRGEVNIDDVTIAFNDNVALLGMLDEIYVRQNYAFLTSSNRPVILDCGANIGVGVAYLKRQCPNAVIYAFEPDEGAFRCLNENVKRNHFSDVHLYQKAVWINNRELDFYADGSWGGGLFPKKGQASSSVSSRVTAADISDFLDQPIEFLKMDIEGAETEVIRHASAKIIKNVKRFFFEWHSMKGKSQLLGKILQEFESAGFRYHIKEASLRSRPFAYIPEGSMDSQLDVFLYKE
jgi:FkbM family methyltransferase